MNEQQLLPILYKLKALAKEHHIQKKNTQSDHTFFSIFIDTLTHSATPLS